MTLKDTLHAASSMAVILLIGAAIGFVGGWTTAARGSPVHVELTNSTIALAQPGYPCAQNGSGIIRCTFADGNTTWVCHAETNLLYRSAENQSEGCYAK